MLDGLKAFPDAAPTALRTWEAETRRHEADAVRTAEYAIALIESEAGLPGVTPPTAAELDRLARLDPLPSPLPTSRSACT